MARIIEIPYEPHPAQRRFHESKARYRAFVGGIGSGKTLAGVHEAIRVAMQQRGSLGMIVAPTYTMLRDATRRTFLDVCPQELIEGFHKTENRVTLLGGSEILFRSADEPDRLRGPNLAWVYVDEAAMVAHQAWRILIGRLRQAGYEPRAWITTTPKGRNWVWQEWVERGDRENYELIRCSSRENPHLPPDFIRDLEASYSGVFARQEIEGEFVGFEGLVYDNFSRDVHVAEPPAGAIKEHIAGVDWGYTNPAVVLVVGIDGDGRMWVVDEFYQRRVMIEQQIAAAQEFQRRYNVQRFLCDPSEPQFIAKFQQAGLPAIAGDNALRPGIAAVYSRLAVQDDGKPRLFVSPRCVNLIVEFENYRYPEQKGEIVKETPLKAFDHALDALRYAVMDQQRAAGLGGFAF